MTSLKPTQLTSSKRAELEKVEGFVFDIQRYSLHDGPGLRTNIFLKGCPLRCRWCANPESQNLLPELALFAHNCINCGQFDETCPVFRDRRNDSGWTKEVMKKYNDRVAVCPTGAIHWLGQRRTAGEIMQTVLRDTPFYENGGGMTLAGGEPTMQPDMAEALLRLAQSEFISAAIETCGHTRWAVLERLLPYLDHILFDVKHIDNDTHRAFTGAGNDLILSNLRRLAALNTPITLRVPLIPGFNDTPASIRAIAEFVQELKGPVKGVDLLPYHTLGKVKYEALGREYLWNEYDRLTETHVEVLAKIVESYGLRVTIGG